MHKRNIELLFHARQYAKHFVLTSWQVYNELYPIFIPVYIETKAQIEEITWLILKLESSKAWLAELVMVCFKPLKFLWVSCPHVVLLFLNILLRFLDMFLGSTFLQPKLYSLWTYTLSRYSEATIFPFKFQKRRKLGILLWNVT